MFAFNFNSISSGSSTCPTVGDFAFGTLTAAIVVGLVGAPMVAAAASLSRRPCPAIAHRCVELAGYIVQEMDHGPHNDTPDSSSTRDTTTTVSSGFGSGAASGGGVVASPPTAGLPPPLQANVMDLPAAVWSQPRQHLAFNEGMPAVLMQLAGPT
ncbi:MAG TPA: hypothetical protein VEU47_18010 [Candidatus Cybelea sp.]|nr:hypothetical protein [Candidatus Cybelea sp.]